MTHASTTAGGRAAGLRWSVSPARVTDVASMARLLQQNALPANDIDAHITDFMVARAADALIGAAGVERYPPYALLRSVVVDVSWRGRGIAAALTEHLAAQARRGGITSFYLLTETAADYFARLGFARCPRDALPAELALAPQLRTLCPASAQAMERRL